MNKLTLEGLAEITGHAPSTAATPTCWVEGAMNSLDAMRITRELLVDHGLTGWGVALDNARRRAGCCNHTLRTISLSQPLLMKRSYAETYNTITHEIAHAIVGHGHGHDGVWQRQHRAMGGDGLRCFEHADDGSDAPWSATCSHGETFHRYKRPPAGRTYSCRCVPNRRERLVWVNKNS